MVRHLSLPAQPASEPVASLTHPLAVWLRELLDGIEERRPERFILIDDEENIVRARRAEVKIECVFHTADQPISVPLKKVLSPDTAIYEMAKRTAKKLFAANKFSRTFAVAQAPEALQLAALTALENKDIVVLENPSISGNVGAVIRTAVALGAGGLVLIGADIDVYDRRLIRASRGYLFSLPVVKTTRRDLLAFCKQHKRALLVTIPHASQPIDALAELHEPLAIAFGNEKEGCSQALIEAADYQVSIPTSPLVESLNVSTAAAITLFQRFRRG